LSCGEIIFLPDARLTWPGLGPRDPHPEPPQRPSRPATDAFFQPSPEAAPHLM